MHHQPMAADSPLTTTELAFLAAARTAVLATIAPDARPRLVPICFVVAEAGGEVFVDSPLDDKPKSVADVRDLARVRDILTRPSVSVLVDRWSEDWSELAWLRVDGSARLVEPSAAGHREAVVALRAKYPQYEGHRLERLPMIRIALTSATSWGDLALR
jgi:PPOX class probable F420-dependent enzyme